MALFNPATIAVNLGLVLSPQELAYLQGFLSFLEGYLRSEYYLEFGTTVSTGKVTSTVDPESLFTLNFVREISKVEIKSYSDVSFGEVLTFGVDYTTYQVKTPPKPSYQIILTNKSVALPYYVEITGKWSFADTIPSEINDLVPALVLTALSRFRSDQTTMNKSGKVIKKVKMDKIETEFETNTNSSTSYTDILENSALHSVLKYNYKYD